MSISSVIYATWAQTNSQIIFLFLSLNEKETKILNVVRIRRAGAVCVTQCGLALSAAKAWGGGTHLTQWIMTLQNNWCLHHTVWRWGYDGIYYWLSIKNQIPWDGGCLCSGHNISDVPCNPNSTALLPLLLRDPTKSAMTGYWYMLSPYQMKRKT